MKAIKEGKHQWIMITIITRKRKIMTVTIITEGRNNDVVSFACY